VVGVPWKQSLCFPHTWWGSSGAFPHLGYKPMMKFCLTWIFEIWRAQVGK
jgi:hypothetical protein